MSLVSLAKDFSQVLVKLSLDKKNFNFEHFSRLNFEDRIKYINTLNFPKIGKGSSRITYALSSKKALKLALSEVGVVQNKEEVRNLTTKPSKFLPKFYEAANDFSWILVELVRPLLSEKELEEILGISFNNLNHLFNDHYFYSKYFSFPKIKNYDSFNQYLNDILNKILENSDDIEDVNIFYFNKLKGNKLFIDFMNYVLSSDLLLIDLTVEENFGKNSNGGLVILDSGINEEIYNEYY